MEDGVQAMRDYLAGLDIASPEHQVLMNVTAKSEVAPSIIKENLSLHLTHTVKWTESLDTFLNMPTPVAFLEISNKPYLGNMLNDFAGVDQQRVMGNDSNLLIVFYVQIMPDDFVMQLHRF
ncbi:(acyl-carrier-protein) S-malonyltransferase-like protein [Escherichia coli]|nr:(acyl-carrier-protein) S-malonyltransferase-like protein [Escherichia coli]